MHVRSFAASYTAPPPRTRRGWRFFVFFILVVCLVYLAYCCLRPLGSFQPTLSAVPGITPQPVSVQWPSSGQAAIGAPGHGVLASQNDATPVPIASVTKVITALVVLQKYPLAKGQNGPTITLNTSDVALYHSYIANDGSVIAVQDGEQLTEYQMLQAMLLPSANNISDSLAIWAYGSLDAYKTAAADFLADNGLKHTQLGSDASGLDPGTISTASDLVMLGELAVREPSISEIALQTRANLPVAGTVYNYNAALGKSGITGLKTGNNDQDPGAFLFTATVPVEGKNMTVVGAVLNQPSLYNALVSAIPLVQSLQNGFTQRTELTKDQVVVTYKAPWGAVALAKPAKTTTVTAWKADAETSRVGAKNITVETAKGSQVGTVTIQDGNATTTHAVTLDKSLSKPSLQWRLKHPF
jgi:D-alanyl-D-alanine carboxypeptidase (penicillin-binding protein 5/6)